MVTPERTICEERVLILAPTGRDAALARTALAQAGISCEVCPGVFELCREIGDSAGAALVTAEAVTDGAIDLLHQCVTAAPAWSDLPLLILTAGAGLSQESDALTALGNVTFLERPLGSQTLITAVRAALRARRRQYQIRDLLRRQETAVERLDLLADVANHLLLSDRPEEIVASVFRKIAAHLRLELYLCRLLDESSQTLQLSSHAGLSETEASTWAALPLHESLGVTVARQGKRVIAEEEQLAVDPSLAPVRALGVTAYACFPLEANGRLLGTLSFGLRRRQQWEHEELAILETVCNQVAVAIERRRTESALQELNQALEKRVEERTAQLRESNDQMEAFTYSISHDLRAPLRAIRGFAQALWEDYGPAFDETGREYLRRMAGGAERLDQLIQDLLQYSRLSRSTLTFEPISLDTLLLRVIQQMEPDLRACGARLEMGPLSSILGHGPTLEQVLTNLLSNAIKFMAPGVQPHIRIWSTENLETARLWVEDNGIGIAPGYLQRIFGVFERLHGSDAYPGTGIGLAIVAKGIARMGGTYGVESEPGQGSRFWIELPRWRGEGPS